MYKKINHQNLLPKMKINTYLKPWIRIYRLYQNTSGATIYIYHFNLVLQQISLYLKINYFPSYITQLKIWISNILFFTQTIQREKCYIKSYCRIKRLQNILCTPESFNTIISHQLFDYTITFVNSQRWNTNSKGNFVL